MIRDMEEHTRENQKEIDEINKDFDYHPVILALSKQLEDKERETKTLEKNEDKMASSIHPSVVRTAIQKSAEPTSERKTTVKRLSKTKK